MLVWQHAEFRQPSTSSGQDLTAAGMPAQSLQKASQQKMLLRPEGSSKQPLIGRDRLSALRANTGHNGAGPLSRSAFEFLCLAINAAFMQWHGELKCLLGCSWAE